MPLLPGLKAGVSGAEVLMISIRFGKLEWIDSVSGTRTSPAWMRGLSDGLNSIVSSGFDITALHGDSAPPFQPFLMPNFFRSCFSDNRMFAYHQSASRACACICMLSINGKITLRAAPIISAPCGPLLFIPKNYFPSIPATISIIRRWLSPLDRGKGLFS